MSRTYYRGQTLGQAELSVTVKAGNPPEPRNVHAISYEIVNNTNRLNPVVVVPETSALPNYIEQGRYFGQWEIPPDQQEGSHFIRWRWQMAEDSMQQSVAIEFFVEQQRLISYDDFYLTPEDVWRHGVSRRKYNREHIEERILLCQQYVEKITGQFFRGKNMVMKLDGNDTDMLLLPVPAISIEKIEFDTGLYRYDYQDDEQGWENIPMRHFQVYSSVYPDERMYPRIKVNRSVSTSILTRSIYTGVFPKGTQNVRLTGRFGFVEEDGTTPLPILQAMMMLIVQNLHPFGSAMEKRRHRARRLLEETNDGHRYEMQRVISDLDLSGDPEVDQILNKYLRPPEIDSV